MTVGFTSFFEEGFRITRDTTQSTTVLVARSNCKPWKSWLSGDDNFSIAGSGLQDESSIKPGRNKNDEKLL